MDNLQKKQQSTANHDDDAAGGKMWAVYVSEAEKYDKALVESWRGDMDGMLIFAGLFSASVVAFLIESYKTLTVDSGDTTVLLLTQISNQLAATANGSTFTVAPLPQFTPQTSSLVCNILWFISLGLSLTCALVATLVEQWAREFIHRADMRSAPATRARVFAYLYYGLKRFKMHTVVEIIPLLLHTSLLFFFAGLVAFLIPVNLAVTLVTAILLFILAAVYGLLTYLPLVYTDCPYQTPLSGALWQFRHLFKSSTTLAAQIIPQVQSMVEAIFEKAISDGPEQLHRDKNALVWTIKSLADDAELEPFVESLPDILWGPSSKRSIYEVHIQTLINEQDPHVRLLDRIQALYRSCDTGLLTSEAANHRRICCYQATWAIGSMVTLKHYYEPSLFHHIIANVPDQNPNLMIPSLAGPLDRLSSQYAVSAVAISRWASFCAAQDLLKETLVLLTACNANSGHLAEQSRMQASQQKLVYCLQRLKSHSILLHHPANVDELMLSLKRITEEMGDPYFTIPFRILLDYLTQASCLSSPPFRFKETQKSISPLKSDVPLTKRWLADLEGRLERIIYDHIYQMNMEGGSIHWIDHIVSTIMSYWIPPENGTLILPKSLLHYFHDRRSEAAVNMVIDALDIPRRGKQFIPATIIHITRALRTPPQHNREYPESFETQKIEHSLSDLWVILSCVGLALDLQQLESVITDISHIGHSLKALPVMAIARHRAVTVVVDSGHSILPKPTATLHLEEPGRLKHQQDEAYLDILSRFIRRCQQADKAIFKGHKTLQILGTFIPGNSNGGSYIHARYQLQFAQAIEDLVTRVCDQTGFDEFEDGPRRRDRDHSEYDSCAELMQAIPGLSVFAAYMKEPYSGYTSKPQTIWAAPTPAVNELTKPVTPVHFPGYGTRNSTGWFSPHTMQSANSWSNTQHQGTAARWITSLDACRKLKKSLERYVAVALNDASHYTLIIHIQGIINSLTIEELPPVPEDPADLEYSEHAGDISRAIHQGLPSTDGVAHNDDLDAIVEQDEENESESDGGNSTRGFSSRDSDFENDVFAAWPYGQYPPGFIPLSFVPLQWGHGEEENHHSTGLNNPWAVFGHTQLAPNSPGMTDSDHLLLSDHMNGSEPHLSSSANTPNSEDNNLQIVSPSRPVSESDATDTGDIEQ
ncbi:hypothetical protein C8R45DRAFT_1007700 [Mycena sanguinolenta]|nr:hypothetical protein C8R45DRAFT_1007700 [Mycena sanguinolenta]